MSFHIKAIAEAGEATSQIETTVGLVEVDVNTPAAVEA